MESLITNTHAIGHPPRSFTVTRTHSGFLVLFFLKYLFGFQCHKSPESNDETEMEISSTRPSRRQKKTTIFRIDSVPRGFRYRYSTEEAGCLVLLKK